jgi:hypothetical protein
MYHIVVEYPVKFAPYDYIVQRHYNQLARREHMGSGFGKGIRDLHWEFKTRRGALGAIARMCTYRLKGRTIRLFTPEWEEIATR